VAKAGGGRWAAAGTGLCVGALVGLLAVDIDLTSLVSYTRDRTPLVLAAGVVGALLWLTPLRRLLALALALLAALWLTVAFTPLVAWLADGLVRSDRVRDADAVFVFGSRLQTDGEPTQDAMSRLLKGLELAAEGHARLLVVSELRPPSKEYAPIARAWARDFAPGTEVVAVGPVGNTRDEAVALARLLRERGLRRVLAVTSPVHTRRAAATLEREGLEAIAVPALETRYDLETLDWPGDRRKAFGSVVHERVGLLVYARRGWVR
jgi:uncharacterized SAM-binding protein YcdF (DUF218 family)